MQIKVYLNEVRGSFCGFNRFTEDAQLRLAATFDLEDPNMLRPSSNGQPSGALEHVFEQLNVGGDLVPATPWTEQYRAERNRSLSVGDVVVVGENAYAVASFGWDAVGTDQLTAAIARYPVTV